MPQTVGEVLKKTREQHNKSLKSIANHTKIKEKFLVALETNDWNSLPDFATTQGFAQSFAHAVGANPRLVAALLRRDYPAAVKLHKYLEASLDKPSLWTPRRTIFAAVFITLAVLGIYLFNQYRLYAAAPGVTLTKIETQGNKILVSGKTVSTATVEVNNRPVLVDENGRFSIEIGKTDLINSEVIVAATSRSGKTTTLRKQVSE